MVETYSLWIILCLVDYFTLSSKLFLYLIYVGIYIINTNLLGKYFIIKNKKNKERKKNNLCWLICLII